MLGSGRRWAVAALAVMAGCGAVAASVGAEGTSYPQFRRESMPCATEAREVDEPHVRFSPFRPDAISAVETREPFVAIGIDDGPDPRYTPAILDVLARHGARATFFVIGRHAQRHPELLRAIVDEGHEVANHTLVHRDLVGRTADDLRRSLVGAEMAIEEAGVPHVPLLRPPRGRQDELAAEVACQLGLRTIGWTETVERHLDPDDAAAMGEALGAGDIVLVHDGGGDRTRSVSALDTVLDELEPGLRAVTVSELLTSAGLSVGRG